MSITWPGMYGGNTKIVTCWGICNVELQNSKCKGPEQVLKELSRYGLRARDGDTSLLNLSESATTPWMNWWQAWSHLWRSWCQRSHLPVSCHCLSTLDYHCRHIYYGLVKLTHIVTKKLHSESSQLQQVNQDTVRTMTLKCAMDLQRRICSKAMTQRMAWSILSSYGQRH